VKAAEANSRLTEANAKLAAERNRPSLDLFANYALNGKNKDFSNGFSDSYHADRPTAAVGLKFTVPFLYGTMDEVRSGALQKAEAASGIYQQRLVDQEKDWLDLVVGLKDAQETYHLSLQVEDAQKRKIENERKLLKLGRSTTFQVLQFEQDYSQSELYRVQAAYQIITLKNQSKLYAVASGGSK
jgi:outer membrane protein TolC